LANGLFARTVNQPRGKKVRLGIYPYTFARVSVMRQKLLDRNDYAKLLKMEMPSIIKYLEETEYKEFIDKDMLRSRGKELIMKALDKNLAATYRKLLRISQEGIRFVLELYLKRWDIHNFKTVLRGKHQGLGKDDILPYIIPAGCKGEAYWHALFDLGSVEEVISHCDLYHLNGSGEGIAAVEMHLDQMYYSEIAGFASRLRGEDGIAFANFLKLEIDLINIRTLLRFASVGNDGHGLVLRDHLIFSGAYLDADILEQCARARPDEYLKIIQKTPYKKIVTKESSLINIELDLYKNWMNKGLLYSHLNPISVLTIISYMVAKEIEVRNLKTIILAKTVHFDEKLVEEKLII